jgi:integrase
MAVAPGKFVASVKVNGKQQEKTFPLGTPDSVVALWKERTKKLLGQGIGRAESGTFAADVEAYLDTLVDRPLRRSERAQQLDWWIVRCGRMSRLAITAPFIQTELAALRLTRSASTCNKYRLALSHLWRTLDGKSALNPVKDVPMFEEPEAEPRNLSAHVVELLFAAWPDRGEAKRGQKRSTVNLAKRVLLVMLRTGLTPAEQRRLRPQDLHLDSGSVWVQRRKKGKGVAGLELPLTPDGVTALGAFRDAGLIGRPFSTRSIFHGWERTRLRVLTRTDLDAATRDELERARPYDLRHTFGTFVLERTVNLKVTQELMRHRSSKTTKRYVGAQVLPYLRAAVNMLEAPPSAGWTPAPGDNSGAPISGRLGAPSRDQSEVENSGKH